MQQHRAKCTCYYALAGCIIWIISFFITTPVMLAKEKTDRDLIFKRSHIAAWMDEPDSYKMCDVDVLIQDMSMLSDADAERWGRFIDKMHTKGKLVCAEMRPATHMNELLEYVMTDDSLQAAACVDIEGKPIEIPWMVGHIYKGRTPVFLCSNQPRYRQFLSNQVRYFMKAGADAIMVDDGGGSFFAFNRGGCFCKHCMKGFRDYLSKKYSAGQLKQKGIRDINSFDYRQFILQREGGAHSYQNRQERMKIPFTSDFHDFLVHSDVELFRELQKLSCDLAGKHIPMGWDNVDFGGLRAGYYPFWDVFYSEINYQHFGVDGRIPDTEFSPGIIMLDKFSDAMGKWYIPTPAPRSWEAIMKNDVESLLRLWVAFSYANGSALRYPRKGWIFSEETPWYFPPKKDFEPLYAFIREHRELFDDYEAVEQVGVLFSQNRGGGASQYYTPLKHVCASLVELNMPFGMAVAGDELLADRLKGDEAEQFELMLIPEPIRLIDGQQDIVNRWKERGRAISVKREDEVAKMIGDRVKSLVVVEDDSGVWLFPRYIPDKPDAPVICHVINPNFDVKQDTAIPQTNVPVRMLRCLFGNRQISRVTYYTPENKPRTLAFDIDGDNIRITIPRVDLWAILTFVCPPKSTGWKDLFDGQTLDGWIQKNGTATYRIVNGTIVGRTAQGSWNSFLCTEKEYGDFELEFDVKVDAGLNTGVQIRSKTRDKTVGKGPNKTAGRVIGPQVEIESSGQNGAEAGYIYSEATGRGWLTPEDRLIPHKHFRDGQWNHYRILAQGPRIQTWINDVLIEDLTDEEAYEEFPRGFIGLQVHRIGPGRGPYEVAWRNIRIREL